MPDLRIPEVDPGAPKSGGRRLAERVASTLESLPMIRDVDTSLESGDEEIHVSVTPERSLQAGLSARAVAGTPRWRISGLAQW